MEQNVSRARRANAEKSADDAGGGHGGFEDVGFKPLVEEIGGAHRHELDERVALVGRKAAETLHEEVKLLEIAGLESRGIGRDHREQRLHEAAHRRHHFGKFVVGFGVDAGMAANFALCAGVVVHAPEVVAIGHGSEGAVEGKDFEAVARKIELANDFRPKKRDDVRTLRKKKAWNDFFGDGGTAEHVAAFEDEHLLPCFSKVGGVHEAVVAAADDDNVVVLRHAE